VSDFTPNENYQRRRLGILPDGGTVITAQFPIGELTLEQCGLIPGATIPRDDTAGIVGSFVQLQAAMKIAVVTAHKPDYAYATAQTRAGVATGAYVDPTTTITATTAIFYPSIAGKTITFDGNPYTVATYVSPIAITVTADATGVEKPITFSEGSRLLNEAATDDYEWGRDGWWRAIRRFHCLAGDRGAEFQYLRTTTFAFDADPLNTVGYPATGGARARDPNYPHKALIVMPFEAPVYDRD